MSLTDTSALFQVAADVVRPLEELSPADFAVEHRKLQPRASPDPGPWSHDVFPYLIAVMNVVAEALLTGKTGVVLMKHAQGGGTEAIINVILWLLTYFPGPVLYMISKDDVAKRFSKDRFGFAIEHCEPLAKKHLAGKAKGEMILEKRFTDALLAIMGGQSVFNLQSNAYRFVIIDEVDSLLDQGDGDPLELAKARTNAYKQFGTTLIIAFAHPTTKDRGAGELYFKSSDQRRGFVRCVHCESEIWLRWENVKVIPAEGQTAPEAERDPTAYHYFAPCCGAEITDAERAVMVRRGVEQKTTLAAEIAAKKQWIGVHFSALYTLATPLAELAAARIRGLDKPSAMQVHINKDLGEPHESSEREITIELWEQLLAPEAGDGAYALGEVPPEVQWLTSGQDTKLDSLHWSVWGWGFVESAAKVPLLFSWLIDCGVEPGPIKLDSTRRNVQPEDLTVFDSILYERTWATQDEREVYVVQGLHDVGYQGGPIYSYCSYRHAKEDARAAPSKGLAADDRSRAPAVRWTPAPTWTIGVEQFRDEAMRRADMNTYLLKTDFFGAPDGRVVTRRSSVPRARVALPWNTPRVFLEHLSSEQLVSEKGKRFWRKKSHENHWLDTAIMAYAAAQQVAPLFLSSPPAKTSEEPRDRAPLKRGRWVDRGRSSGGSWWRQR